MAYSTYMTDNFESEKNKKATGYTALICVLLLVVFLFVKWSLPEIPPPPTEEGIEVNLGNSDQGLGEDQPFLPGQPAPADEQAYTPPKQSQGEPEEAKDFETDDKDEEAPVVAKPPVTKPNSTKVPEKEVVKNNPVTKPAPATPPAPKPPKPKAVFKGVNGTGTGGNEADSYKKGGNEGVAGGTGDQGRPGGNPDSDNYTGNGGTGKSGVSKLRGLQGRNMTKLPSFTDDFNENAKVAVDITVDAQGNVVSAVYQPRGSTTAQTSLKEIAIRKARQIKFNATGQESMGTLQFNFRLRN
jgi:outer membrane biosynthesis protein TonB